MLTSPSPGHMPGIWHFPSPGSGTFDLKNHGGDETFAWHSMGGGPFDHADGDVDVSNWFK